MTNDCEQHEPDDPEWEKKVWGLTRCTFASDRFERHELLVRERTCCSVHWHRHRANKFIAKDAVICVVEFYAWNPILTWLSPDMTHVVPSRVPHQFVVAKSGTVFEEYWPDRVGIETVLGSDIVRLTTGKRLTADKSIDDHVDDLMRRGCNRGHV